MDGSEVCGEGHGGSFAETQASVSDGKGSLFPSILSHIDIADGASVSRNLASMRVRASGASVYAGEARRKYRSFGSHRQFFKRKKAACGSKSLRRCVRSVRAASFSSATPEDASGVRGLQEE